MRRKKIKNISVATVANGYVLKYEGMRGHSGFMYFNAQELTAGLLKHVVLGVKDEQNKTMCECLLQSMATLVNSRRDARGYCGADEGSARR